MTNILASGCTTSDQQLAGSSEKRHVGKKPESLLDPPPVRFSYG
jgi:hypothetical protein